MKLILILLFVTSAIYSEDLAVKYKTEAEAAIAAHQNMLKDAVKAVEKYNEYALKTNLKLLKNGDLKQIEDKEALENLKSLNDANEERMTIVQINNNIESIRGFIQSIGKLDKKKDAKRISQYEGHTATFVGNLTHYHEALKKYRGIELLPFMDTPK